MEWIVTLVLIGLLWFYARGISEELQELRRVVLENELRLDEVDGRTKGYQPPPVPSSGPAPETAPKAAKETAPKVAVPDLPPAPSKVVVTPPAEPAFREIRQEERQAPIPLLERLAAASSVAKPIKSSGGWEEVIGLNLLNKLGALLLVIGIALFLSYSFPRWDRRASPPARPA
jgi:uncharacterized membrane protein